MKQKSQQLDIQWIEPEPFALVIQTAPDGERIAAANREQEANQCESDQQQQKFHV